jgi:hypothetical protein
MFPCNNVGLFWTLNQPGTFLSKHPQKYPH